MFGPHAAVVVARSECGPAGHRGAEQVGRPSDKATRVLASGPRRLRPALAVLIAALCAWLLVGAVGCSLASLLSFLG